MPHLHYMSQTMFGLSGNVRPDLRGRIHPGSGSGSQLTSFTCGTMVYFKHPSRKPRGFGWKKKSYTCPGGLKYRTIEREKQKPNIGELVRNRNSHKILELMTSELWGTNHVERNNRRPKISLWDERSHHFSELLAGVRQGGTGESLGSLHSGRRRPFGSADDVSEADLRRTYSPDPFFCSLALKNWTLDIYKKKKNLQGKWFQQNWAADLSDSDQKQQVTRQPCLCSQTVFFLGVYFHRGSEASCKSLTSGRLICREALIHQPASGAAPPR